MDSQKGQKVVGPLLMLLAQTITSYEASGSREDGGNQAAQGQVDIGNGADAAKKAHHMILLVYVSQVEYNSEFKKS